MESSVRAGQKAQHFALIALLSMRLKYRKALKRSLGWPHWTNTLTSGESSVILSPDVFFGGPDPRPTLWGPQL